MVLRKSAVNNKTPLERVGPYSYEEFVTRITSFHGYPAPGVIIGGIMVDMAKEQIPDGVLFNAICETLSCLPDAVQLFTPCTSGNGWLTVLDLGKYALTLYDKYKGNGIRVYLDPAKLNNYDEIKKWFLKLKTKNEQNSDLLNEQIRLAGRNIYTLHNVQVQSYLLGKRSKGDIGICKLCGEAYPTRDGKVCKGCQGKAPYEPTTT